MTPEEQIAMSQYLGTGATISSAPLDIGSIMPKDVSNLPKYSDGMFGGLGGYLDKMGITSKDGDIFGINKEQQKGLGELAGLGSGLWNMYSANRGYGMMKDYYNNQMALQNEQMQRVRDEDTRVKGMREGLAKNYGGK